MRKERLLPLIGVALFLVVFSRLDFGLLLSAFGRIDYRLFALSAAFTVPAVVIKAYKWTLIVKSYGIKYPLGAATGAFLAGFFVGSVTPGRIGDLCRALYLRKDAGVSMGRSLTTVIVDRVIDIGALFFISMAGLLFVVTMAEGTVQVFLAVGAAFAAFAAAVFVALRKRLMVAMLRPLFSRFAPQRYRQTLSAVFHDFYGGMGQMDPRKLSASVALSFAGWAIVIMQYYILTQSAGLGIPVAFLFGAIPVVMILDALPISFSGIGTREASLVFFFSLAGAPAESAFLVSLMLFVQNYLFCSALGLFFWVRHPVDLGLGRKI